LQKKKENILNRFTLFPFLQLTWADDILPREIQDRPHSRL
jgi:hypothetical protein